MFIARTMVGLLGLAVAACTARQPLQSSPDSFRTVDAVEIANDASFPVVVKYYTQGGGPHPLGVVASLGRETFTLPGADAGYILVQTESGKRIGREADRVRVWRYTIDPATGDRIGSRRAIR